MKTRMFGLTALAIGLVLGAPAPASAHRSDWDIALHLGPAYVRHGREFHRLDRGFRYEPRHRFRALNRRHLRAHDVWHYCVDGRWYPYYDRRHWRFHEKLRPKYRRSRGHRHW